MTNEIRRRGRLPRNMQIAKKEMETKRVLLYGIDRMASMVTNHTLPVKGGWTTR